MKDLPKPTNTSLLGPEHLKTTDEAVVATEPKGHVVAEACAEAESCTSCKATLVSAA